GTGEASTTTLENQNITVSFNSKGGQVEEVVLKNYKDYKGNTLVLFDKESSKTDVQFTTNDGKNIRLSDLYFSPSEVQMVNVGDVPAKTITYRADLGNGQTIDQIYTLVDNSFEVGYKLDFK